MVGALQENETQVVTIGNRSSLTGFLGRDPAGPNRHCVSFRGLRPPGGEMWEIAAVIDCFGQMAIWRDS